MTARTIDGRALANLVRARIADEVDETSASVECQWHASHRLGPTPLAVPTHSRAVVGDPSSGEDGEHRDEHERHDKYRSPCRREALPSGQHPEQAVDTPASHRKDGESSAVPTVHVHAGSFAIRDARRATTISVRFMTSNSNVSDTGRTGSSRLVQHGA